MAFYASIQTSTALRFINGNCFALTCSRKDFNCFRDKTNAFLSSTMSVIRFGFVFLSEGPNMLPASLLSSNLKQEK